MTLKVLPHHPNWSDHAALSLALHYHVTVCEMLAPTKRKARAKVPLPQTPTPLDTLLRETLALVDGHDAQLRLFYGDPWGVPSGLPVFAYIGAAECEDHANTPSAGASVYWGPHAQANWCQRVPGLQSIARASLWAMIHAVREADPARILRIWTPDTHLAHTLCHWAPVLAHNKWSCAHADLIRPLVELIRARGAAVRIYVYDQSSLNAPQAAAMLAACRCRRTACQNPTAQRTTSTSILAYWPYPARGQRAPPT